MDKFELLIIGAGTGGMAAAKKAASYGVKVGLVEKEKVGGTCLNRGCTPKKLMVYAADFALKESLAASYGWQKCDRHIDWKRLMHKIHQRLDNLSQSFLETFQEKGIEMIWGEAKFISDRTLKVQDRQISADRILIAVGGHPIKPDIPGKELAITSREMFQLEKIPEKLAIIGGGYIGTEFASMMNVFGSEVVFMDTDEMILSGFDRDLRNHVHQGLIQRGIKFIGQTTAKEIEKVENRLQLNLDNGENITADVVLLATGRAPNTKSLDLERAGIEVGDKGEIKVDSYCRTNREHIYAIGDCIDRISLTPVAKAEASAVIETMYGKQPQAVDYTYVTSAVFARPEAATIGMSEREARKQYGEQVRCYCDRISPMLYSLTENAEAEKATFKLVVKGEEETILGAHMVGEHAADIIQSLGVAIALGITKPELDRAFGIHPTIGEEWMSL